MNEHESNVDVYTCILVSLGHNFFVQMPFTTFAKCITTMWIIDRHNFTFFISIITISAIQVLIFCLTLPRKSNMVFERFTYKVNTVATQKRELEAKMYFCVPLTTQKSI